MGTYTEKHECKLTDAEIEQRKGRVIELDRLIIEAEAEKRAAMGEHNSALKALRSEHLAILEALANGSEKREVEMQDERVEETGCIVTRRLDTGEVTNERAMSEGERQESLFDEDGDEDGDGQRLVKYDGHGEDDEEDDGADED